MGTPAYPSPPQWVDTDLNGQIDAPGDRALPVGYPRNTNSVVSARFAATIQNSPNPPPPFYSLMVKGYNPMSAYQPYYYVVPPTTVLLQGSDLYLPPTTIYNPVPGTVNYGTLGIIWSFSNDGGMNWSGAGGTANELYVTLDTPEDTSPVYHTLLFISVPISGYCPSFAVVGYRFFFEVAWCGGGLIGHTSTAISASFF